MKKTQPYKLILADDHILLRDAVIDLINNFNEFRVIGRAADGKAVIEAIENNYKPDIILLDLNMPKMDGYATAKWLSQHHPKIKIVILTMFDSEIALIRLIRCGISGFIKKDIHPAELRRALITIAEGGYYYSDKATHKVTSLFSKDKEVERAIFTDTEIEFLKLVSTESTYREIAMAMNMTARHIDTYRNALFMKIGVTSRTGLVIYAVKHGIISF